MLSDVEKGTNLMLTPLTPVAALIIIHNSCMSDQLLMCHNAAYSAYYTTWSKC